MKGRKNIGSAAAQIESSFGGKYAPIELLRLGVILITAIQVTACSKAAGASDFVVDQQADDQPPVTTLPLVQPALAVGQLGFGGSGCQQLSSGPHLAMTDTELTFLIETSAQKDEARPLERATCNVALPVQVPAGFRMVIEQFTFDSVLNMAPQSSIDSRVEVFFAGSGESEILEVNDKARAYRKKMRNHHEVDTELMTQCGDSFNLRSNSALVLKNGTGLSRASLSQLKIKYRLEACP